MRRTSTPIVNLKTDPEQNKVIRDGKLSPVSRLIVHPNGDDVTVEVDIRTTCGYVPVTLTVTCVTLTEFATQWLRLATPKRLLKKWREGGNGRRSDPQLQSEKVS